MVKELRCCNTFSFTWDQVASAFWRRYPNPQSTHVLSEDTFSREMRGDSLYTVRVLTKTNSVPKWGEKFVRKTQVLIVEESLINSKNKTIITYTRNIGYNKIMSIEEKVVYTPSAENEKHTLAERTALIGSSIFGFRRAIEGFGLERFRKNCTNAVAGFNFAMNSLFPVHGSGILRDPMSRFEKTSGNLRQKARRAGEIAKDKAESTITPVPMYAT